MDLDTTFNCCGKVNLNDWQLNKTSLLLSGELDKVFFPSEEYPFYSVDIELFNNIVPANTVILNINHFVKCMEMQLKIFKRYENYGHTLDVTNYIDFFSMRKAVCRLISFVRTYMNSIKWDYYKLRIINPTIEEGLDILFSTIKRFLGRLRNIPESIFHYAASNLGNKCVQPEFHLYHLHLDLRWLYITLIYMRNVHWQYSEEAGIDDIENVYRLIISDLIYISCKIFERIPLTDLRQKTPYSCTCMRELWLMLQIFIDELANRMQITSFWDHINFCINTMLDESKHQNSLIYWNKDTECSLLTYKNPELFCIWIIYHFTLLYGYNNDGIYLHTNCSRIRFNYEQVEKILKAYVSKGGKDGERDEIDEELQVMIPLLRVLITDWWPSRIPIVSLLWDCFHKRLDQPFLLQTSGPWTLSLEKKTPMDIFKHIKDRIDGNFEQVKESSYGMFLRLLGSFLKKNYDSNDTKYWNQIKGRVYSKFSKSKVQEFSETGLYNFLSLFLTLAVTADTLNVSTVMLDLLPSVHNINNENARKCNLIWKGRLVILLLFNELGLNFTHVINNITETVNIISCHKDETSRSMMINFVDILDIIFSSDTTLELGEHLFIGGWIDRYLLECSKNRVHSVIKILICIFKKCNYLKMFNNNLEYVSKMLDALWSNVACRVRQLAFDPLLIGDHYHDLARLAVAFTLNALKEPGLAKKYKHSAASLFHHFATSLIVKDIRITRYYLMLILQKEEDIHLLKKEIKNLDLIFIQAWIKCSILGYDENWTEIQILQNYIAQLNEIREIFVTNQDFNEFKNNKEAILIFIMSSMRKRKSLQNEQQKVQFDIRYRSYFNNIDKWILSSITEESQETELAFWIYRCVGTLILCSSPMFYVKNQANSMLKVLLHKIALPTEQSPQCYIKNLCKRIFSMIILGLESLNIKSDISLQVLTRNLFDQYISILITEDSSGNFKVSDTLLKCFHDAKGDFSHLLFEMLMTLFFTISSENNMHKHNHLVSLLLKTLLKGGKMYAINIIELIVTICVPHIITSYLKVHDHHPHKHHAIDFMNSIFTNHYYKENVFIREKLMNILSDIIQRYLTTYPQSLFEFMRSIASLKIGVIKVLLPQIESIIIDLEKYKRPNAASLRYTWNQFQNFIRNMENKQ
ncbi:protein MMS22-like isoform X1 [Vespa mandarinia]|uniref:protein MMS22-like isoform X1 n=2 Tax=Vespa mandarinia TaxID=7446 RepID=UPI0016144D80|nr:protein MMS22-like isoform X1 [Vespa mandarinia]XP_035727313.1 protein MMS22-like isoform X1 [Vespa mandarinia]XP_035727314.1 protein MMS22-like isoform X1 [Vespa mandarinia]